MLVLHAGLLTDSGFEYGDFSGQSGNYGESTITDVAANNRTGSYAFEGGVGGGCGMWVFVDLEAGKTYTASAWGKLAVASVPDGYVQISGVESTNTKFKTPKLTSTDWQKVSISFTVEAGFTTANMTLATDGTLLWFDDMDLVEGGNVAVKKIDLSGKSAYIAYDILKFKGYDNEINVDVYSILGSKVLSAKKCK